MLDLLDRLKTALADRYRVDREIGRGGEGRDAGDRTVADRSTMVSGVVGCVVVRRSHPPARASPGLKPGLGQATAS